MTLLGENTVEQCVFMYIMGTSTVVYVTIWDVRPTKKAIINNTGLQRNPFLYYAVSAQLSVRWFCLVLSSY